MLCPTVLVGNPPLCFDPAAPFQSMERRIKRTLSNLERSARDLAETLRDGPAMLWLEGDGLQQ
jgi:hypothetical protein